MNNERKELLVTNLNDVFDDAENISLIGAADKWRAVPYEVTEFSGMLLSSLTNSCPPDITYSPKLEGWYKIYITRPGFGQLYLKLTSDETFIRTWTAARSTYTMEEVLWRCADMTGQSITITRKPIANGFSSSIAAFRFVPMTDEEVAEWKYEDSRTDTRSLYATDDMHNRIYSNNINTLDEWLTTVIPYRHSDVEWFSPEEIRVFTDGKCPTPIDEYGYFREGDRNVQKQLLKFDFDDILKKVVDKAREMGIKTAVSLRMAAWGLEFPYDQTYYDCPFLLEHPEWYCLDRNGDPITALSYAYPEVRKYLIDVLVNSARSGCDAVNLIGNRGIPYVLFEKPVADKFFELYGEYPYELPLDEPRLNKLHCDIMTGFFRELREALDENFGKNKVGIHLRCQFSMADAKYVGFDTEELAREGLINLIISYPQRFYERFTDGMWKDETKTRIDLEKYTAETRTNASTTFHTNDFDFIAPYVNSRGEMVGPESQEARIKEWNDLGDRYGIKVYFEIFPRCMPNPEFKRRTLEMYDKGARNIALWDTFCRVPELAMWNLVRKFGHKEELRDMPEYPERKLYRVLRYEKSNLNRYKPMWGG